MNFRILTLGAGLALAAGAAAFAADAPASPDQRTEERVVIICDGGPGGPHGPGGPGMHGDMHADMHARLDANGDGSISRDEFRALHDDMFGKLDKNHDGKLSGDEFPHGPGGPGGPGEERFEVRVDGPDGPHGPGGPGMHGCGPGDMAMSDEGADNVRIIRHGPGGPDGPDEMDANKDGRISFDEFVAPLREHFNAVDKNHNGFLDKDEMTGDHQFIFRREEHH